MTKAEAKKLVEENPKLAAEIVLAASELMYHYFMGQSPNQQKCGIGVYKKFRELDKSLGTDYTHWQKEE